MFTKLPVFIGILFGLIALSFPTHALTIEFDYNNYPLKGYQKAVFTNAAGIWERALIPPNKKRQELSVKVSVISIDGEGKILANARPTDVDSYGDFYYSRRGEINVDIADLNNSGLVDILTHEIGHVLGFGTLWDKKGLARLEDNSSLFIGEHTMEYYTRTLLRKWGTTDLEGVPLEDIGGPGTIGAHWCEAKFGTELMTSIYNPRKTNPLSRLTLASFQDMGYQVNYTRSQPYSLSYNNQPVALSLSSVPSNLPHVISFYSLQTRNHKYCSVPPLSKRWFNWNLICCY